MRFFAIFTALVATVVPAALAVSVTYDTTYDQPNGSMNSVACSNGPNGLITKFGFQKFSDIPNFPYIGGASAVTGWNSPNCGTCWELTFTDGSGNKRSINVLAVDFAANGFNIGLNAMNDLTNGNGVQFGVVDVVSKSVPASVCKL